MTLSATAPADRLLLLGHINHAAAAFADLLQEPVAADFVSRLLQERFVTGSGHGRGIGHYRKVQ